MGVLDGVRILDLTQIMSGPYATMVLGDLGADVIKIEKINGGDDSRRMGPFVNGESISFFQINRNKKSIALNLKSEEGKDLFYKMAKRSDIVIENFRPGVVKSLGIDYETLKQFNPQLIYCQISGYGQDGPYAHKGGFDLVAQGMAGMMSMTGQPGERPVKAGSAIYDIGAGITAIYSILAAYIHKQNTGEGQLVDVSLVESGLPWFIWEAAGYFGAGKIPGPTGSRHRVAAPYQAFKAKDGYMILGAANQRTWERFCEEVIEKPEWIDDPRFKTNTDRQDNVDELETLIEAIFKEKDKGYWIKRCEQAGVPAGPINNFEEAVNDEHYNERGMIREVEHPVIGKMNTFGPASKLSKTPGEIKTLAPILGQHTDEVLTDFDISTDEIEMLKEKGVILNNSTIRKEDEIG